MRGSFRWISRLLGVAALLFLWSPAESQPTKYSKWIHIAGTGQDQGLSYDPESITPFSHDAFRVWTKTVGRDSSENTILREINCSDKIIRNVQVIAEKRKAGAHPQNIDRSWRGVVRGTPEGELYTILCQKPAPESYKKPRTPFR